MGQVPHCLKDILIMLEVCSDTVVQIYTAVEGTILQEGHQEIEEVTVKIIRLIANLSIFPLNGRCLAGVDPVESGPCTLVALQCFYAISVGCFDRLMRIESLSESVTGVVWEEMERSVELLLNTLSALTNLTYYIQEPLPHSSNLALQQKLRSLLTLLLVPVTQSIYLMHPEIQLEAIRCLGMQA